MNVRTKDLNQQATYWPPLAGDGFGHREYGAGVLIACRWQDKNNLISTAAGKEVTSTSIVYVDRHLQDEGKLALGDHTSEDHNEGRLILARGSSPDLRATEELLKVWL